MQVANSPGVLLRCSLRSIELSIHPHFVCTFLDEMDQEPILEWLLAYAKKRILPFHFDLSYFTPFQQSVFTALQSIPFGDTRSYEEIAHAAGSPRASRAVGSTCGANPYPLFIPCHRVVSKDGTLGGFSADPEIKQRLLSFERQ